MELIAIVAMLALSVVLSLTGTRAIFGVMFSVMARASTAHNYANSSLLKDAHLREAHKSEVCNVLEESSSRMCSSQLRLKTLMRR